MFDFMFIDKFPSLGQSDFEEAYTIITTQYSAYTELWQNHASREAKRLLFINYLVAWYLANMFPDEVVGVVADGGKPLNRKNIGGVDITYRDIPVQTGMEQFTTNVFGLEALRMYHGCPERFKLYGRN